MGQVIPSTNGPPPTIGRSPGTEVVDQSERQKMRNAQGSGGYGTVGRYRAGRTDGHGNNNQKDIEDRATNP